MAHGGARAGAGRPRGAASERTREIADKAVAEGLTPLEFMLGVLRSEDRPHEERFRAAVAAAPYIHPRLSAVDVKGDLTLNDVTAEPEQPEAEWMAQHGHA